MKPAKGNTPKSSRCRLKVVKGTFAGDSWTFASIDDADEFIVRTRREGAGGLVKKGTMEIHQFSVDGWKTVGTR